MSTKNIAQFIRWAGGFKAYVSLLFCGLTLCYTAINHLLLGNQSISYSMVWQFLGISVVIVLLQALCYSNVIFKKLRYSLRTALFGTKLFATLALFAWFFKWFPTGQLTAWLIFGGIFLFILVVMALVFQMYYRITGERYTAVLEVYQQAAKSKAEK